MKSFDEVKNSVKKEVRYIKWKVENKTRKTVEWVKMHPQEAATLASAGVTVIAFGGKIVKGAIRSHNLAKEEALKNLYVYDNRLGHYWLLRRPLKNNEWLEIADRKAKGEMLGDILSGMKVLR